MSQRQRIAPSNGHASAQAAGVVHSSGTAAWRTRIEELATAQHGVVSRRQLLAAGVPAHVVGNERKNGRLRPAAYGVYRVGAARAPLEAPMVAVLGCGDTAVVSHVAALELHGVVAPRGRFHPIDVTVRAGHPRSRSGVRVHRTRTLDPADCTNVTRIPVTTATRAIFDTAAHTDGATLERLVARTDRAGLLDAERLARLIAHHPSRAGTAALRAVLGLPGGPAFTRSEAERHFLDLLRQAELPPPVTNAPLEGLEVDAFWPRARLVVEVDGYGFHASRRAFERDRRRDAVLAAAGYRTMRVTWEQITRQPVAVAVRIAQALVRPP